jgi:hypothetical protein
VAISENDTNGREIFFNKFIGDPQKGNNNSNLLIDIIIDNFMENFD